MPNRVNGIRVLCNAKDNVVNLKELVGASECSEKTRDFYTHMMDLGYTDQEIMEAAKIARDAQHPDHIRYLLKNG